MTYISSKLFTFEEFLTQYGNNSRYELIDGELRDMEPTGPHEAVSGVVAGRIYAEILRANLTWLIPKNCLIQPPAAKATALRPNVIVLDAAKLKQEPCWQKEPVICNGNSIKRNLCWMIFLLHSGILSLCRHPLADKSKRDGDRFYGAYLLSFSQIAFV